MRIRTGLVLATLTLGSGLLLSAAASAQITIGVQIRVAPPELPVYEQPPVPAPGYLWSPGYWAWGDDDYYWVPGTWVQAPQPGYLWTPGYWGWGDEGVYLWHGGYWGEHVGFYGGVNYGYGYGGHGYEGGEWRGGSFFYNRSVNNVANNVHITNVYNRTVVNNVTVNRVSFNGGQGGVAAQPTSAELAADHEHHLPPVGEQLHHQEVARANPALRAAANHGAPPIAATAHAAVLSGPGVVGAHGAAHPVAPHPVAAHAVAAHPAEATQPAASHPQVTHPAQTQVAHPPAAVHPTPETHSVAPPHDAAPRVEQRAAPAHPPAPHAAPEHPAPERAEGHER